MASREKRDEARRANMQLAKEKSFRASVTKLGPYPIIALCLLCVALLLMFTAFAEVYNTDINGPEVKVSGFSFAVAGVTRDFSSVSSVYGDMAVPFYYYAESYTVNLATAALVACIALIAAIVMQILARVKGAQLNIAAAAVSILAAVLFFVCLGIANSMTGSDILPYYCSSNPACSIRSYAVFPAILALLTAGFNIFAFVKYLQAKKLLA